MKLVLTQKETEMKAVIRDKWINLAFEKCSSGIDSEKFETGIEWFYQKFLSLPKPQIVYCDSLIDAGIKITLVKDYGKELEDFNPQMTRDYENGKLDEDFMSKLKANLQLKSGYIGWSNFGWVSFYNYFTEIDVINNENFNQYQRLIESNVFEVFEFEKVVFAVKPPIEIHYKEKHVIHNIDGSAIKFSDGTEIFIINGFRISKELFTALCEKTYTVEDFFREPNEEIKSAVISYLQSRDGETGVYNFLKKNLNEVDTYNDVKKDIKMEGTNIGVYTLFKGEVSDVEIAYVRCHCPSTDRTFFLGVEPSNTNAKDAIASLYQVPEILKNNIISISRQGEKFVTNFDEITTENLKNNVYSESDLKTYTNISGKEYFRLMSYEC